MVSRMPSIRIWATITAAKCRPLRPCGRPGSSRPGRGGVHLAQHPAVALSEIDGFAAATGVAFRGGLRGCRILDCGGVLTMSLMRKPNVG